MKPKKLLEYFKIFMEHKELDVVFGVGAFSGGHCVINDNQVVVVNKRMPVEEQLRVLVSVILELELDYSGERKEVRDHIEKYVTQAL